MNKNIKRKSNTITILEDLQKDNVILDSTYTSAVKFEYYEIENNYIYGKGKKETINIDKLFTINNKLDLLMKLLNIGKTIYENDNITKNVYQIYTHEHKIIEKPHITVDISELDEESKEKIIDFFITYGMFKNNYYDLNIFIRRILDLYCTIEIWNKLEEGSSNSSIEEFTYILYPQYRKNSKTMLYQGVATNIQEKGLFIYEKNEKYIYEYFLYNAQTKNFEIMQMSNDFITLAYHQLSHIISSRDNGDILPKCKICGDYLSYERMSKQYCDSEQCKKIRQQRRTAKSREKKKKKKEMEKK